MHSIWVQNGEGQHPGKLGRERDSKIVLSDVSRRMLVSKDCRASDGEQDRVSKREI